MIHLSQRDPRWATLKLAGGPLTIGRDGCTTTAISMLTDYFSCYQSPAQIAAHLDWYVPPPSPEEDEIIWTKLSFTHMGFAGRTNGRNDKAIQAALKDPNLAVILQVAHGSHWVVATDLTWLKNDYKIVDPWTGGMATACGTYTNITGFALFARK